MPALPLENAATPHPLDPCPTLHVDGATFRDLDGDGALSPYEDWRRSPAERADDLLTRMTLDEQIGCMLHGTASAVGSPLARLGVGTHYDLDDLTSCIHGRAITSFISRLGLPAAALAAQSNEVQRVAAQGRLGIPVTLSTDPRHQLTGVLGASVAGATFSVWPGTLGLAALRDTELVRRFGDAIRREYRAVGFHMALSPMADLATSPRWPRIEGTFGEDPALVRRLVGAYVEGIQGGRTGAGNDGVAAVVKHWVGYGAARDGFDGHNFYGRHSAFPSGAFERHVEAFLDAFACGVEGVMPTYNILEGLTLDDVPLEQVGAGFSAQLLDGLLRTAHGFAGVVVSDWAVTHDATDSTRTGAPPQTPDDIAMPWGVEHLARAARFAKGVNAGIDQFGGEDDPAPLLEAVRNGLITPQRIAASARRVLVQKFRLGLFDRPFVDADAASAVAASAELVALGASTQRRSITMLRGRSRAHVTPSDRVHVSGMPAEPFTARGIPTVADPSQATVAVVRMGAPYQTLHPDFFFGARQHEGDLDHKPGDADLARVVAAGAGGTVPVVAVIGLDRPAVLTALLPHTDAIVAEFGSSDDAIADVLCGAATAEGRLPFQLSGDMDAVLARPCDAPAADPRPLFALGHAD